MTTIYTIDKSGVFVGAVQHDPRLPLPRCTLTPPPATEDGEFAVFTGAVWEVLTDYPKKALMEERQDAAIATATAIHPFLLIGA